MRAVSIRRIVLWFTFGVIAMAWGGGAFSEASTESSGSEPFRLWYRQPAKDWNEALPLGNGSLGAMVFGKTGNERIQLNEDTLWSGFPYDSIRPGASKHLDEVRRLIFEGKNKEATDLANREMMGDPLFLQAYQPLGDLWIDMAGSEETKDYERELDVTEAVCRVRYTANGIQYTREYFISYPAQALIVRLSADQPGAISMTLRLDSPHQSETVATKNGLTLTGQWIGDGRQRGLIGGLKGAGIKFESRLIAELEKGTATVEGSALKIADADAVVLKLSAATSFRNYKAIDLNHTAKCEFLQKHSMNKDYATLLREHLADYQRFYDRVTLDLKGEEKASQPTDKRLEAVKKGEDDPQLVALYFQYGRYMIISGSRPGTQPLNLQGIWNKDTNPAWGSKYTTNINTEMNYWPVEVVNLPEFHQPLFTMLNDLRDHGSRVAREYYNARGFVLHHNTDLWRVATPVDGIWGLWPMGAAWLARHPYEHYAFSQDKRFLRETAFPILKDASLFMLDFLVEAPKGTPMAGKLVTNPSHSPENRFRKANGEVSQFTYAATMDLMIVHDLFTNTIAAIDALSTPASPFEPEFRKQLADALSRLAPLQISPKTGRLQEWIEDYDEPEPGHRHMSHIYGLHPGHQITPLSTPELAEAVRKSLAARLTQGGGHTGWSRAWLINFFARLYDGDAAHEHVQLLLQKSTYPNLFDSHPPFQFDGNMGATAAIAEMLLQSHDDGYVHVLPALPKAWPNGSITGLRARGGWMVDRIEWRDGQFRKVDIRNDSPTVLKMRATNIQGELKSVTLFRGTSFKLGPDYDPRYIEAQKEKEEKSSETGE